MKKYRKIIKLFYDINIILRNNLLINIIYNWRLKVMEVFEKILNKLLINSILVEGFMINKWYLFYYCYEEINY